MKTMRIGIFSIMLAAAASLSGCGGKNGSVGVAPSAVAPAGNRIVVSDGRKTVAFATGTLNNQKMVNYIGIPAPPKRSGRTAAAIIPNTTEITLTPSAKGMSFSEECGATVAGKNGSVVKETIWLSMAAGPCWKVTGMVEFDIETIMDTAPDDIVLVELRLYEYDAYGHMGATYTYNFNVAAYPNMSPWDEATAWYFNMPAYDTTGFADNKITLTDELGWKTWVVTDIVRSWASYTTPNYGLHLMPLDSGAPEDSNVFLYDETSGGAQSPSLAPQLVVYVRNPDPLDLDRDGVQDITDMCPGAPALPGFDADLNGCTDNSQGLRIYIQNLDTTLDAYKTLNRMAKCLDDAVQAADTAKAVRVRNRMTRTITGHRGADIPAATADVLQQYIDNVLGLI